MPAGWVGMKCGLFSMVDEVDWKVITVITNLNARQPHRAPIMLYISYLTKYINRMTDIRSLVLLLFQIHNLGVMNNDF